MINTNSISVIVAALNEEQNLRRAAERVIEVVEKEFDDYEIIIVDDGSTDGTADIAEELRVGNHHVIIVRHPKTRNLGVVFREGVRLSRMYYVILVDGKGFTTREALEKIFALRQEADIVVPYTTNSYDRPLLRRLVSDIFTGILNILFNLRIKYYNHSALHRKHLVDSIDIITDSYAFQAETIIKLVKSGCSYVEVGVKDNFSPTVRSKAFKIKNILF